MATFKLHAPATLTADIAAIKTTGAKLDQMIQDAAIQCIGYSVRHGDIRPANALLTALPQGARRTTFVAFMEKYGNLAYMDGNGKVFEHYAVDGRVFDGNIEEKWYDAKKEVVRSTLDCLEEFDTLIAKLQKRGKKEEVKHADLSNQVALIVAQYRREHAEQAQ